MHRFLQHHMGCWMRWCRKKLHCNFSSQYYCLCVASNVKNYKTFLSAIILRFHFVLLHYMRDTPLLWISNHIYLDFERIRFFFLNIHQPSVRNWSFLSISHAVFYGVGFFIWFCICHRVFHCWIIFQSFPMDGQWIWANDNDSLYDGFML